MQRTCGERAAILPQLCEARDGDERSDQCRDGSVYSHCADPLRIEAAAEPEAKNWLTRCVCLLACVSSLLFLWVAFEIFLIKKMATFLLDGNGISDVWSVADN